MVVFCRSGRHRSVAASELLKGALLRVEGWRFAPTKHITIDIDRGGCLCEDCKLGREICESIENPLHLQFLPLTSEIHVMQVRAR